MERENERKIADLNYRQAYVDGYLAAMRDAAAANGRELSPAEVDHWRRGLLEFLEVPTDKRIDPPALGEPSA